MVNKRRVVGCRLDGLHDLLIRAAGVSVMDIGCNRGLIGYEFAKAGARLVHGCDNWEPGIRTAQEIFADMDDCENRFEVVDLLEGPKALDPFGAETYDLMLVLAVTHKLVRVASRDVVGVLIHHLGKRTLRYFAWRAGKGQNGLEELPWMESLLLRGGFKRIYLSEFPAIGPMVIWERRK